MSKFSKESQKKKICFIVMNHSVPVWKVEPLEDEDDLIDSLLQKKYGKEMTDALEKYERGGKHYTSEELRKSLGL